jgi:putative ABC transport system permease protein
MLDLQIAWRNLLRNPRRSVTTLLAVAIGIVALLLFSGFTGAVLATLETGIVSSTGHVHIEKRGFGDFGFGNPSEYSIENTGELMAALRADPGIAPHLRVVTPLLLFQGLASRYEAGSSRMMSGEGVVVADQRALRHWDAYGLASALNRRFALPDQPADAAIIGLGLGRMLDLCAPLHIDGCAQAPAAPTEDLASLPDDVGALAAGEARAATADPAQIDLLTVRPTGAPNVVTASVASAENQGLGALDNTYVAMHLDHARKLVFGRDAREQSTILVVQLDETAVMTRVRDRINALIASRGWPLEAKDFYTFFGEYRQVESMFHKIFGFMAVLITVIVLFTVANTMSAAVIERTTEIGTLRALGVRRGGVRRLFLLEGLLLALFGVAVGVALAIGLATLINHSGITWVPPNRVTSVPLLVNLSGRALLIGQVSAVLVAATLASAWLAARRGARRSIVEALRHA